MSNIDFSRYHGCACGRPGNKVARRTIGLLTTHWEVDIEHDNGIIHTNEIKRAGTPQEYEQVLKNA